MNNLARKVNKTWEQVFDELDLSPAHAYVLRLLLQMPGMSQRDIALELNLEKSTVTRFVLALEARDYLFRKKNGREQLVFPTAKAEAIEIELEQSGNLLYRKMQKIIGKKELEVFVKQIRMISREFD